MTVKRMDNVGIVVEDRSRARDGGHRPARSAATAAGGRTGSRGRVLGRLPVFRLRPRAAHPCHDAGGRGADSRLRADSGSGLQRAWADVARVEGRGVPTRLGLVSGELFPTLGVKPVLGRTLVPDDDRRGAAAVAVLSEGLWERRYGRDPDVLGRRSISPTDPSPSWASHRATSTCPRGPRPESPMGRTPRTCWRRMGTPPWTWSATCVRVARWRKAGGSSSGW
jgi:hypothetical protein